MSKQIERVMKKHPQIFYDVSYEGSDGIWLYMNPSWYCSESETGCIHDYTVKDVMRCAKNIYQDKEWYMEENPDNHKAHKRIINGEFDSNNSRFIKNTKEHKEHKRQLERMYYLEGKMSDDQYEQYLELEYSQRQKYLEGMTDEEFLERLNNV
jgi:hypothetical protein